MLFSTCLSGVLHIRPCHCCTRVGSATWPPRPSKYGHVVWKIQAISLMVVGLFPCLPLLRTKSTSTNYTTFPSSSVVFGDILPSLSFLQLELDFDRSCGLDLTLPIPIHDRFPAYFFPIQLELDIQHSCGLDLFPSQTWFSRFSAQICPLSASKIEHDLLRNWNLNSKHVDEATLSCLMNFPVLLRPFNGHAAVIHPSSSEWYLCRANSEYMLLPPGWWCNVYPFDDPFELDDHIQWPQPFSERYPHCLQ